MKHKIRFTINREVKEIEVEPNRTLLKMLREDLDLIGAKEGCGAGECGACTVMVDNKPVNSCLMLAVEADGVYWHGIDRVKEKDARKDRRLLDSGWDVLRFTGDEIRQSAQGCIDKIASRMSA